MSNIEQLYSERGRSIVRAFIAVLDDILIRSDNRDLIKPHGGTEHASAGPEHAF
jgi:hypothetical protein